MGRQRRRRAASASDKTPSYTEWLTMEPHEQLAVCTEDLREFPFSVGDTVAVLSSFGDTDEWYGIIDGIRQRDRDDLNDVWVRLRWFYSPEETEIHLRRVKGRKKSVKGNEKELVFNPGACSPTERILSDHYDIITTFALEDVVTIQFFDESDLLEQGDITSGQLFYRYHLISQTADLETSPPCLCLGAYSLSGNDLDQAMRLCMGCKRAWHHRCLFSGGFVEENGAVRHLRHLIFGQIDEEEAEQRPTKKRRLNSVSSSSNDTSSARLLSLVNRIPPSLLLLAAQPLVRGAAKSFPLPIPLPVLPSSSLKVSTPGANSTSSKPLPITGNVCAVSRARLKLRELVALLENTYRSSGPRLEDDDTKGTRLGKRKKSNPKPMPTPKARFPLQPLASPFVPPSTSTPKTNYNPSSNSDADLDADGETDSGTGDNSRLEEAQVLRELELETDMSADDSAPEGPSTSVSSSSTRVPSSLRHRSRRPSDLSKIASPSSQKLGPALEGDLSEWLPEPDWERYIVTPIWIPLSVSQPGESEVVESKAKRATRSTAGADPTTAVPRRSTRLNTEASIKATSSRTGGKAPLMTNDNKRGAAKTAAKAMNGRVNAQAKANDGVELVAYPPIPALPDSVKKQIKQMKEVFRCPGCGALI
ncbi:hypothetical protein VKT23_008742 [Stygiomarasmius scandens]|uniref:BAH domain-containing protein n=1 Tax=Marasmiellus scandens TaxID=2682957 RepID=A0ABR1JJL9_9AGAR